SAQRRSDLAGNLARTGKRRLAHLLRLPALHIVAPDLPMPDRRTELRFDLAACTARTDGELRDLVVEIDHSLDDDTRILDAAARHRIVPGWLNIVRPVKQALPLAGGRHDRLHETGKSDARLYR